MKSMLFKPACVYYHQLLASPSLCSLNVCGHSFKSFVACVLRQLTLALKSQEAQIFFRPTSFQMPSPSSISSVKTWQRISDAKIKEGLFFNTGSEVEKAWKSFRNVTTNFLREIMRHKSFVKWWLILCSHTMLGVKYVFKGAFLWLSLRLLLRKSWGSEWCAQRVISLQYF